ncbi:flavodoxin reductase [Microbacterium sp. LRZ72]|uniref:FAD-dependent oxidoreductase n=1 Tax=Microbacterium sp. LRZ72 TaxID=2942481 RepID=UPI0029AFFA61|nr:flavodoxin reductase [Microbacterium sp. LRZ72]MDX2375840.1 flavodoxin reductase [Microbacterium sp. LRZ72]
MIATLTAAWTRMLGSLGRFSMYRLVLLALALLTVVALVLSVFGLVLPTPLEMLATGAVLGVACVGANALIQRMLRMPMRHESSLITAYILLFILRPTLVPLELLFIGLAGVVAVVSKYVIAWRGRHILNPAAVGASVLTISGLGASAWWVGTPVLAAPVIVLGLAVLVRTERLRIVAVFVVVAVGVAVLRLAVQSQAAGVAIDVATVLEFALLSSPFLFLGAFMLSEPLTLPPRRWQQLTVAAVVGVLAGWPIPLGSVSLGQERALLIGNLVAFIWAAHQTVRLRLRDASMITPTVRQLTFESQRPVRFSPGQYVELEVPHAHADARGTRREFSIVSAPSDAPLVRIAYRVKEGARESSYKRALATAEPGVDYAATGIWGDFVLPRDTSAPVLLVAAGIGVTPFVSQLREMAARGESRDVVLVYSAGQAAELAFRDELAATGVPVIVVTRDDPSPLPAHWRRADGIRIDAAGLLREVPDLSARHAYVSGPPSLVADLSAALDRARSLTTDAFAGY